MADSVHNIFERVDAAKAVKAKQYKEEAAQRERETEKSDKTDERLTPEKMFLEGMGDQLFAAEEVEDDSNKRTQAMEPDEAVPNGTDEVNPQPYEEEGQVAKVTAAPPQMMMSEPVKMMPKVQVHETQESSASYTSNPADKKQRTTPEQKPASKSPVSPVFVPDAKQAEKYAVDKTKSCSAYLISRYDQSTGIGAFSVTAIVGPDVIHEAQKGNTEDPDEYMLRAAMKIYELVLDRDSWCATIYTQSKDIAMRLDKMARKLQPGPAIEVRRQYVVIAQEVAKRCGLTFASMVPTKYAMLTDATMSTLMDDD